MIQIFSANLTHYHTSHNRVVGHTLRAIRENRGIQDQDLARNLGVSISNLNKIEGGNRVLTLNEFFRWCDLLNVDYGGVMDMIREIEQGLIQRGVTMRGPRSVIKSSPFPYDTMRSIVSNMPLMIGRYSQVDPGFITI